MADSLFGNLLQGGVGAYGYNDLMDSLKNSRNDTRNALTNITNQGTALAQGTFKPYSVTSNYGKTTANPDGSVTGVLSKLGQQQTNAAGQYGLNAWNQASMPIDQRQNQLFGAMGASMAPEQARARAEMEAKLSRSGRLGMMTNSFGGTPEQLAYEKSLQEQYLKNWLGAQGAAQSEQKQAFDMGQGWLESSQLPTKNLMDQMQIGMANKGMNNAMTTQLMDYLAQMGLGSATNNQNFADIQAKLAGDMYNAAGNVAGSIGDKVPGMLEKWL